MRKIYSALDIGSSYIKVVVGEFINNKLNILCAVKSPSLGFKNNQIINEEKLIKSINNTLNIASTRLNFKITKVILNIPTDYNEFILTENTLPIENEDKVITSKDIIKISQNAPLNHIKKSDELIACLPVMFKVGDHETNKPLGKKGNSLTLKSILVISDKKRVYDLVKLVEKCELEIVDITTTGLVDYYNFKNKELDSKNNIVINIGSTTTNISVFSKGIYINNITIDVGGLNIDEEIALKYNLRKKDSEELKEFIDIIKKDDKETIDVKNDQGKIISIKLSELNKIASNKLEEMLKIIKKNINYLTKKEISYIIITGGLTEIKNISEILYKVLGNKIEIGTCSEIGARDNSYSVALGMLKYFHNKLEIRGKDYCMIMDEDITDMTENNGQNNNSGETIIGKVFSYFFDN